LSVALSSALGFPGPVCFGINGCIVCHCLSVSSSIQSPPQVTVGEPYLNAGVKKRWQSTKEYCNEFTTPLGCNREKI